MEYYEQNGTLDGSTSKILESASDGFMKGTAAGAASGMMAGAAKYAKNPTGYCFIAGTFVVTFLGLATIDSIQEGDYVLAKDMDAGVVLYQPVIDTFVREVDETYTITIDGVDIETTAEHPFYSVEDDAFIPAKDLESGDTVETADGDTATVEDVTRNDLDEPTLVYNFEVMDAHTYYVGEDGVLVHNECKTGEGNKRPGNRPENLSPDGAGRKGAFREAKRKNGIPVSEQPKKIKPNVDRRGKPQSGKIYEFENGIEIRDDAAGHIFEDNPFQNRGPHFDDPSGNHFDY